MVSTPSLRLFAVWCAVVLTLLTGLWWNAPPHVMLSDAIVHNQQDGSLRKTPFPVKSSADAGIGFYTMSFTMDTGNHHTKRMFFHIVGDDCVRHIIINQTPVDISKRTKGNVCDYTNGFEIDLSAYLQSGINAFVVTVENTGYPYGLNITALPPYPHLHTLLFSLLWAIACGTVFYFLRVKHAEIAVLTLANFIFMWWFLRTDLYTFSMDMTGHIDYIKHMTTHWLPPRPNASWLSYHPPLYYAIVGKIVAVVEAVMGTQPFEYIRFLSLLVFNGFLMVSMGTIDMLALPARWKWFAYIGVAFWPAGIMIATRIDSNLLMYTWCALCFLQLLRWYHTLATKHLAWSLLWLALGIATRSNAYVMVPVIGCTVALKLWQKEIAFRQLLHKSILIALLGVCLATGINTGRILYYRAVEHSNQPLVVGNMGGLPLTPINRPSAFLTLETSTYFDRALYKVFDAKETENFWNILLKSSGTGEFAFKNELAAYIITSVILLFWIFSLIPILTYTRADLRVMFPFLMVLFWGIAALMLNRINVPFRPSGDFRYIYFILPALIALQTQHVKTLWDKGYVVIAGIGISAGLAIPPLAVWLYMSEVL
jgi:hypothetical protein